MTVHGEIRDNAHSFFLRWTDRHKTDETISLYVYIGIFRKVVISRGGEQKRLRVATKSCSFCHWNVVLAEHLAVFAEKEKRKNWRIGSTVAYISLVRAQQFWWLFTYYARAKRCARISKKQSILPHILVGNQLTEKLKRSKRRMEQEQKKRAERIYMCQRRATTTEAAAAATKKRYYTFYYGDV